MILFIHGGAFISGNKDSEIRYVSMMVSKGYACASINYTLLDNTNNTSFERILDDIHNSIDKIKELSDENNWNIKYLATSGYSAGGLLSLLFSYTRINDSSIPIKFAVAYVPVVEFSKESFSRSLFNDSIVSILSMGLNMNITHENFDNDPEIIKEVQKYSPLYQINKNSVPSLILSGLNDIVVDKNGGRKMVKKLKENNVEYDYIELPNSGHYFLYEHQDNELIVDFDNLMEEYAIKYFKD
jgi:acetyl esterase/lipase